MTTPTKSAARKLEAASVSVGRETSTYCADYSGKVVPLDTALAIVREMEQENARLKEAFQQPPTARALLQQEGMLRQRFELEKQLATAQESRWQPIIGEARELLLKAAKECDEHNREYHYHTDSLLIAEIQRVANALPAPPEPSGFDKYITCPRCDSPTFNTERGECENERNVHCTYVDRSLRRHQPEPTASGEEPD